MTNQQRHAADAAAPGRLWVALGAALAGLAVVLGALGAHGFDRYFAEKYAAPEFPARSIAGFEVPASWKYLQDYKTAVRYQMWHALGLIALGLLAAGSRRRGLLNAAGWCLFGGVLLFCGSLYALTLGGPHWLDVRWGLVAPVGGTLLIAGWALFAVGAVRWTAHRPNMGE
ncbi:MAG: DUF423 domain-containing protein [Planctomycetota bacterium]|nr:MAG: DUF423 domain-containing protein [Planctomycetota bacterium]